ncbi:aldo/keto reductase [Herbidospora mongoliensis]|uniref:aldo/keto reductase n=1 Tax=Herbidospora mongoliensis TaxID=688067 RepID=UPI000A0669B9|nr:aldo/keto reductase [Herbidospora mongoliensis]
MHELHNYNLLYREEEREMIPLCADQGVGLIPWSPLARGLLARAGQDQHTTRQDGDGNRQRFLYGGPGDEDVLAKVAELANERGVAPATLALAWLLHQPGMVAPIIGATKDSHIPDALAAVGLDLSEKELATLQDPYQPRSARF